MMIWDIRDVFRYLSWAAVQLVFHGIAPLHPAARVGICGVAEQGERAEAPLNPEALKACTHEVRRASFALWRRAAIRPINAILSQNSGAVMAP